MERVILTAKSLDEVECILQESGFQTRRTSFSKEDTHKIEAQLIKLGKNPEHQHIMMKFMHAPGIQKPMQDTFYQQ